MDKTQINRTPLIPMISVPLQKKGAVHQGPCPFCGGVDRFTVIHPADGDKWHCRKCGDGKYHDVIAFIMRRDQISFKDACKLSGVELSKPTKTTAQPQAPAAPRKILLPDQDTQKRMLAATSAAAESLDGPEGEAQREYLTARGLKPSTWAAWLLGAAQAYDPTAKRTRPAVSIPWYYYDTQREFITAIKYRFIDEDPGGARYTAEKGSSFILFGTWARLLSHKTLLVVEGEINALSFWQCLPEGLTVLSIGSEGNGRQDTISRIAARYQHVFIWCDDAARSLQYTKMLSQPATGIQSPVIDGRKIDANNLLQAGKLSDFIRHVLKVNCD